MKKYIVLSMLYFLSINLIAQEIRWSQKSDFIDIANKLSIFEDKTCNLTIQQISQKEYETRFELCHQSILHFGFNNSAYWLKFILENKSQDSLFLQLEHAFIPYADLYFRDMNGDWKSYKSGYKVNLKSKLIKDHFQAFPLLRGRHEYYVRLVPYVHPVPIKIWNSVSYQLTSNRNKILYGIYIGILLFVIIIHLFLFLTLRFYYYLIYCILIFSYILASAGVLEGYIIYFFPNVDLLYLYKVIPAINMPILLIYCLSFLEMKKFTPKLYIITKWVCLFLFLYLCLIIFLPNLPVIFSNWTLALLDFIFAGYIGIEIGRRGNRIGYYFTFTYLIWFSLIFLEELNIQYGNPPHIFQITYVSIAILIESFLLALLLAKRFQWGKQDDERDKFELQESIYKIQQSFEREILQVQLEVQEQTFNNISQEIHDNLGQTLSVVNIYLETIDINSKEDATEKIEESMNLVTGVIRNLKNIAKSLNTDYMKSVGLINAVHQQVNILKKTDIYQIEFLVSGEQITIDNNKQLLIFRIIQELLNNIIKHAQATAIEVDIQSTYSSLSIRVFDNGKGFDFDKTSEEINGLGLINIVNRLNLINGSFSVDSKSQTGTNVFITVPL